MALTAARAHHVGSLIRPDRLLEARARHQKGDIDAAALRTVEDACIAEVVRLQEEEGFHVVSDGEFRRMSWSHDFLYGFDNVVPAEGRLNVFFRDADGRDTGIKPAGIGIKGKLGRSRPIQLDDFSFLKSVARVTAKVCIPSPTMLHFRNGRRDIDPAAYPTIEEFFDDAARCFAEEIDDLVAHGLRFLQIDDPNFGLLCDPRYHDALREIGEDPEALIDRYVALINAALANVPPEVHVSIHLCRGNGTALGAASGGYEPVAEALLGGLNVDSFFLEYDDDRSGDFAPLRFVAAGKQVVLGLVTTKRVTLEDRDTLRRRIDAAAAYVPLDRLSLSPQCGFASGVRLGSRRALDIEHQRAKLRLVVETAHAVWGSA
jgi:5-methyltetrahydropteroyltriglutamate--homocysteine methyltransferase